MMTPSHFFYVGLHTNVQLPCLIPSPAQKIHMEPEHDDFWKHLLVLGFIFKLYLSLGAVSACFIGVLGLMLGPILAMINVMTSDQTSDSTIPNKNLYQKTAPYFF